MKNNIYAKLIVLLAIGSLCLSALFLCGSARVNLNAKNGFIDLSNIDFSKINVALDGEWEFYKDVYAKDFSEEKTYISVPNSWDSKKNKHLGMDAFGKGTYRVHIKVPKPGTYMLNIGFVSSCYEAYANGECILKAGRLPTDTQKEKSLWKAGNAVFTTDTRDVDIVFFVANYVTSPGGIYTPVTFGEYDKMFKDTAYDIVRSAIFIGIFIGFGLYLMLLYNPGKDKNYLYLGIICISCCLLDAVLDSYIMYFIFDGVPYVIFQRLQYVVSYTALIAFGALFRNRFLIRKLKFFYYSVQVLNILALIWSIVPFYSSKEIAFTSYILLGYNLLYEFTVFTISAIRKEKYSVLCLFSLIVIVATVVTDIIGVRFTLCTFSKAGIFVVGIIFFLITQMYILSRENIEMYEQSCKVKEMENAFLQAQIAPHFFFNTMNNIYCLMDEDVERAKGLVMDFCSFLRAKHKFDYRKNITYTLWEEIELIDSYIKIENERYHSNIELVTDIDDKLKKIQIPQLLLQPLVENSIKHGFDNKKLLIQISCKKVYDLYVIEVVDDGKGMGKEYSKMILDEHNKFRGIGLSNVNYRVNKYFHTSLELESGIGTGTKIIIKIPQETQKIIP